jgi:hypothetical protein
MFNRATSKKGTNGKSAAVLFVQVYQGPALQCEAEFGLSRTGNVRIGKSSKAEMNIPFAPFPNDLFIFTITRWGARVRLDPHLDGFVSDGQRFGSVRDFIAPRGALKELASVLEPLEVPIPEGSRGALEIAGYKIVFRVAQPKPLPTGPKITGAPKAPFGLPEGQTSLEKLGFFLGVVASILVTIPGVVWLNKVPIHQFKDLRDLSPFVAVDMIHPDHFRFLPWAFSGDFSPQAVVAQSVQWVDELRNKWANEEAGRTYSSSIPVLRGISAPEDALERQRQWQSALDENWKKVSERRESASPGTFLRGQSEYTPFRVVVAGGASGSIPERVRARLERLERTYLAATSIIETEHIYLKDYFKQDNAEIQQIFDPPKEPGLFFRLAEPAFKEEQQNFSVAESFAALADKRRNNALSSRTDSEAVPIVWSGDSLSVASVLTMPTIAKLGGSDEHLFKNADLSLGVIPPPPAPKPVPKISMTEVESFVRSRSPEVKGCYDTALNRNPRLSGSIIWKWTIAESGKLHKAKVEKTSIKDSGFIACLEKKVKGWTFPKPINGAITISFPFRFVVRENLDTLDRYSR